MAGEDTRLCVTCGIRHSETTNECRICFLKQERTREPKYEISLTQGEIELIRRILSDKFLFLRQYPMPEDQDLAERIAVAEYQLWVIARSF